VVGAGSGSHLPRRFGISGAEFSGSDARILELGH